MMAGLEGFEDILKKDKKEPEAEEQLSPGKNSGPPTPVGSHTKSAVEDVIQKLKRSAERPHEAYLNHLSQYKDADAYAWSSSFPIGYRERVAPTWLGEVY